MLLHNLFEPREPDALGRRQLGADLVEGGKSALVRFAFRKPHINQRAHSRLDHAALIDALLEIGRGLFHQRHPVTEQVGEGL